MGACRRTPSSTAEPLLSSDRTAYGATRKRATKVGKRTFGKRFRCPLPGVDVARGRPVQNSTLGGRWLSIVERFRIRFIAEVRGRHPGRFRRYASEVRAGPEVGGGIMRNPATRPLRNYMTDYQTLSRKHFARARKDLEYLGYIAPLFLNFVGCMSLPPDPCYATGLRTTPVL